MPRRTQQSTVRWVVSLFAVSVITQRISLPGGTVPILLPLIYLWCAYALRRGLMEFDLRRLRLFLAAAALTAAAAVAQDLLVPGPLVSLTSWGLLMTIWAPGALRLVDRGRETLVLALRGCIRVGEVLAVVCLVMLGSQLIGLRYEDWLALVVPKTLLVQGYVITYPIEYASSLYRANAWIGLEPSIVSLQLGLCLTLAVLVRARMRTLVLLGLGMISTVSGSGIVVFVAAVLVMMLHPIRRQIARYFVPGAVVAGLVALTPIGIQLVGRLAESSDSGSSTSLRALVPYQVLWPRWTADPAVTLLGQGAGSSQTIISDTNIAGLLVASPIKVFFDYGLIAGVALAAYLLYCYLDGPSRSLGVALLLSSWLLQPGTTTVVLVLPTLLFITWWAPRAGRPIEADPLVDPPRARLPVMAR